MVVRGVMGDRVDARSSVPHEATADADRRRTLVILDINGILVDRRKEKLDGVKEDLTCGPFYVYHRPFLREVRTTSWFAFTCGIQTTLRASSLTSCLSTSTWPCGAA